MFNFNYYGKKYQIRKNAGFNDDGIYLLNIDTNTFGLVTNPSQGLQDKAASVVV